MVQYYVFNILFCGTSYLRLALKCMCYVCVLHWKTKHEKYYKVCVLRLYLVRRDRRGGRKTCSKPPQGRFKLRPLQPYSVRFTCWASWASSAPWKKVSTTDLILRIQAKIHSENRHKGVTTQNFFQQSFPIPAQLACQKESTKRTVWKCSNRSIQTQRQCITFFHYAVRL